jgi:hypothetical protein
VRILYSNQRTIDPNDALLVEYKPQRRTIFVDSILTNGSGLTMHQPKSYFLQFPYILFLKFTQDGESYLYSVFSENKIESLDQIVYASWLPNTYEKSRICCWSDFRIQNMINNFWSQQFNTDGLYGCLRLIGMWSRNLTEIHDCEIIRNGRLKYIHKALENWQNASYQEVIEKIKDGYTDGINKLCGHNNHPIFYSSWKLKEWVHLVYGKKMKSCFGVEEEDAECRNIVT